MGDISTFWQIILLIALIPISIAIVFPIFWLFVIWLISIFSGWQRLAERYRAQQAPTGKIWQNQYGLVNGARYGNVLTLTTNDEGIFVETMPLFGFNHPRLFIPWHDMHNPTEVVFRWRELIQVEVGFPTLATMSLPAAIFKEGKASKLLRSQ